MRTRLLLLLSLVALLALPSVAFADKGFLYVQANISPETAKATDGVQHAQVFVYKENGEKVSSGKGSGSWLPGSKIPVEEGTYWVGIGQNEIKEALFQYQVDAGKTTTVKTGWVSIATLDPETQPHMNCATWTATLRAYVRDASGERVMVLSNDMRNPGEYGSIQLHPGTYEVEFHNFFTEVEVKGGQDFRVKTGYTMALDNPESYLIRNKDDDEQRTGLPICTDGPMHVLAGDYYRQDLIIRDDGQTVEKERNAVTIDVEGNYGHTSLKSDKAPGKAAKHDDDGEKISESEQKSLSEWGKKKGEFDDLDMFSDPF